MSQFDDLECALITGTLTKANDDPMDLSPEPANPVERLFAREAFEQAGGPKDFQPITTSEPLDKVFANRLGISNYGSAAQTSLAKTEEWTAPGGEVWKRTYNSSGELVDAQVVGGDGGELSKHAPDALEEGTTVDLSKRASKRGMVNLVKTTIDGSPYILGYDFQGANVYCRALDDDSEPLET